MSREGKELEWARREGGSVMGQTWERALGHAGVEGNGPWDRAVRSALTSVLAARLASGPGVAGGEGMRGRAST